MKFSKAIFLLLTAVLFFFGSATILFAQHHQKAESYSVKFKIKNFGFWVDGSFKGLQATINFDPADPESGSLSASVKTETVNTDNGKRDKHLKSEDYFDVENFPKITLKSISLKKASEGEEFTGKFNLTIKGVTKEITFPFTFTQAGNKGVFKGSFKIDRRDFGIGKGSMILSDTAVLNIILKTVIK